MFTFSWEGNIRIGRWVCTLSRSRMLRRLVYALPTFTPDVVSTCVAETQVLFATREEDDSLSLFLFLCLYSRREATRTTYAVRRVSLDEQRPKASRPRSRKWVANRRIRIYRAIKRLPDDRTTSSLRSARGILRILEKKTYFLLPKSYSLYGA